MKLNIETWKDFKVSELFDFVPPKGKVSTELIEGNDISYIGAKYSDNGLMMRCSLDGFQNWVSEGNCIVFICLGEGSAGYTNYIPNDFIGMSGKIMCAYLKDRFGVEMNPKIGMFVSTVLNLNRPKYSFGRSWTGNRLYETIVKLPAKQINGEFEPDWDFMNQYMESLNWRDIKTENKKSSIKINIKNWKMFKVGSIFEPIKIKKYSKTPEGEGTTNFISSTASNNGVSVYCDEQPIDANCITVSTNGECFDAFYQPFPLCVSNDVEVLYSDKLNKYNALFICSVLRCEKFKWAYGRKPKDGKVFDTKILLPAKNGVPDWAFMEDYIKSLPNGDLI